MYKKDQVLSAQQRHANNLLIQTKKGIHVVSRT